MQSKPAKPGVCICVVAGTGQGKTTLARRMVSGLKNVRVYNLNNEEVWKDFSSVAYVEPEEFISMIEGLPGTYVLEDAAAFLSTRSESKPLKRMLAAKRHTPQNFVLLFHALCQIPKWLFTYVDIVHLGVTKDRPEDVRKLGQPELLESFEMIRKNPLKHYFKPIKIS